MERESEPRPESGVRGDLQSHPAPLGLREKIRDLISLVNSGLRDTAREEGWATSIVVYVLVVPLLLIMVPVWICWRFLLGPIDESRLSRGLSGALASHLRRHKRTNQLVQILFIVAWPLLFVLIAISRWSHGLRSVVFFVGAGAVALVVGLLGGLPLAKSLAEEEGEGGILLILIWVTLTVGLPIVLVLLVFGVL